MTTAFKNIAIIGGGIGGLFCGAMLAKCGVKVDVLEKNTIKGGGLQQFVRKGKAFETGMHILGGFQPGGSLNKICGWLGILEKLDIKPVDRDCIDEIFDHSRHKCYRFGSGREAFAESLCKQFPSQEKGIKAYMSKIYELSEEVPLFYLNREPEGMQVHSDDFLRPADQLIADFVSDPELQAVLAYFNPLYGGVPGHTPAYVHALISVLYIEGSSRFAGGSLQLANALEAVIESAGGKIHTDTKAAKIEVDGDGRVCAVISDDGRTFPTDGVVSAIHPLSLAPMLPKGVFKKAMIQRLNDIPLSISAFSVFIDLKPDKIEYVNHTCYYIDRVENMWTPLYDEQSPRWPSGFMYMTPPDKDQGKYASRILVHCMMDWKSVEKWESTTRGHRPEDYEEWKRRLVSKVLDKLEIVMPGVKEAAANVYAASPLTIRDYYATPKGAIFGYLKDSGNIAVAQIPVYTRLPNLWLSGQNINLHGICGVPLTAINTVEAILGKNSIVDRINSTENHL